MLFRSVNTNLPLLLEALGFSPLYIGILQGFFEITGMLYPFLMGSFVDKKGNYGNVLFFLSVLLCVTIPWLGVAYNFWFAALILVLVAVGFKSLVPISDGYISILLGKNTERYGHVRVVGSISFVVMALFLQYSNVIDTKSPKSIVFWFWIPAFALALILLFSKNLRKHICNENVVQKSDVLQNKSVVQTESSKFGFKNLKKQLKEFSPVFYWGIFLIFLQSVGMVPSQKFFSLYVRDELHLNSFALFWAIAAFVEIPFMFFSGGIIKRLTPVFVIKLGLVAVVVRNLIYLFFPSFTGVVFAQLCHAVSFGLFHPAAVIFVAQGIPANQRVLGMTLYSSVALGLSSVLGTMLGGWLIESGGYSLLFIVCASFPFLGLVLSCVKKLNLIKNK